MTEGSPNQASSGSDVFVSYASPDAAVANSIVEALERRGLRCWIAPRDIVPGSLYADGIVRAINEAAVFVLVLSEHAVASAHVGREIERAASKGRPIMAIRTDSAPLSPAFEYFLSESQWIDLEHGDVDAAARKLFEAIRHRVDRPSATVGVASDVEHGRTSQRSIAILPFADMSEKKDQEFLADGMAEEIINLLVRVPDLLVPARTSSFYFKGKPTKIPEIARELGVANVLEGSIRRSGDRLRVTAQLVRADNGYHVWSENYDRELRDVFAVQDDIANAIVQALQIKLMGGELSRRKGGTQNLEAYQLFLRGTSALNQNTKSSLDAADEFLNEAIKLDRNYGMAWSQLAATFIVKTDGSWLPVAEGYERARQLAQHALQLSPDLADAHAWLQYVHRNLDFDWAAAQAEGRRALAIDPTNLWALNVAGLLSTTLGRWDDAERQFRLALERDPFNPHLNANLGFAYYGAGRFDEAERMFRKVLELAPGFVWIRWCLGRTLVAAGKLEAASALIQQHVDNFFRLTFYPAMLQTLGRQAEADEALNAQIAIAQSTNTAVSYFVALTYASRGDRDRTFEWLERAYELKNIQLVEILGEHLFKNFVGEPRYDALLRKLKLLA